ncbi:uncharacterized protein LOC103703026 [Phoenix dactylifera]|uniref:Uncharacterized protein LOC103703026 n=1 Tax=Phoenix dactylifera TaxID=42345 RepID=A0A8B7BRL7_PHODC|nr:uncharacterized protein LOC103703026 [Phoenix dactylifera]
MSAMQAIERQREGAEVFHGAEICKKRSTDLLEELHLPRGLLPLSGLDEVGFNRETGFVWMKQNKGSQHVFKKIGKTVFYGTEVTAFVEDRRMKRMTGVKSKEFLLWVSLSDMYIDERDPTKITFKSAAGIGRSFPVSAFEEEEEEEEKKGEEEKK